MTAQSLQPTGSPVWSLLTPIGSPVKSFAPIGSHPSLDLCIHSVQDSLTPPGQPTAPACRSVMLEAFEGAASPSLPLSIFQPFSPYFRSSSLRKRMFLVWP